MAHVQEKYSGLWYPQDPTVDKISSQKMFIDNIHAMEALALSTMQNVHKSVQTLDDLRAIDTSDATLFKTGMLVMVHEYGLYSFNRNSTATASNAVVIPTVGPGRWIATMPTDIAFTPIEVQSNEDLNTRLESILANMSDHSMKFFILRMTTAFQPFEGGTIHMTMYKVSNLYASIMCTVYNSDRVARVYTRARYDGIWGGWVMLPFLDVNGKIPVSQLPSTYIAYDVTVMDESLLASLEVE